MNNEEISFLLEYSSPNSILVVTHENKLIELHCPFQVRVLTNFDKLKREMIVYVDAVKLSTNMITIFIICGNAYYYWHFEIIAA